MHRKDFIRRSAILASALGSAGLLQASASSTNKRSGALELVVNAGISGNNTNNLLKRIDTDCLAHKPSLTIMMIGTNDMNNGKFVPPDKFRTNLRELSGKIMDSGSKLLLMTILPFYEPYLLTRHPADFFQPEGPSGKRVAMNTIIKEVAAEKSASFFDVGSLFEKVGKIGTDKDSLLRNEENSKKNDGVHPTPNGYRFLGLAVSQFIQFNQLPVERIVCFGDSITRGDGSVDGESYPAYLKKLLS